MQRGRRIGWPIIALASFALVALLRAGGALTSFERHIADARALFLQHETASDIVIIGIDAQSLAELKQWPWPRRHHAALIDRLAQSAPGRVFLDIDFSSSSMPEDDARLEDALAHWPHQPVVLPAFFQPVTGADAQLMLTQPLDRFARHAALASVNLQPGSDGLVRVIRSSWSSGSQTLPSVVAYGERELSAAARELPIDFTISPASFTYFSYNDVLAGRVAPAEFAGKTVYVGATAIELGDMVPVPVHRAMPGVALLALASQTLVDGVPGEAPAWLQLLSLAFWSGLCAALLHRCRWRANLLTLGTLMLTLCVLSIYLYSTRRLVLEVVPGALTTLVAFGVVTLK